VSFESRYAGLNASQKAAVDTLEGPLMVVAGPGTGKTELLSMRAANILRKTDVLPENILCLTFTESGAFAMRERLKSIIGQDAYRVAIHTFHSFGTEIMNHYPEYFYNGASFSPASDVAIYEVIRASFEALSHDSPLASTMNGEFTYLRDAISAISELKRSGLTGDELLHILRDNERVLDSIEPSLQELFTNRITQSMTSDLADIALQAANLPNESLPPGISPLANIFAISLSHSIDEATETQSTKPLTAWRNSWLEKDHSGHFVFKDRKRIKKLRALSLLYSHYLASMQEQALYDFDDMVLNVVHALEVYDDLRFTLQERYQYIMVDEFQDTNLAQARIIHSLGNNPVNEGAPNLMVVGDDDQAIYSFQGAEVSNILQFRDKYETASLVTLVENYRSADAILTKARDVITLGENRLERYVPDLSKKLQANYTPNAVTTELYELDTQTSERAWLANHIAKTIKSGVNPDTIAVIARRHHELVSLLPYLQDADIKVNYEKRDNVLEHEVVIQLEMVLRVVHALTASQHDAANAILPRLLSHPAWSINAAALWKLSLEAHKARIGWMEQMAIDPLFQPLHAWLVELAAAAAHTQIEALIDISLGTTTLPDSDYTSPLHHYFFASNSLEDDARRYIDALTNLRTLRDHIREHLTVPNPTLANFIEYIDLQRSLGSIITAVTRSSTDSSDKIHLLTAHRSKGLEFDHVYIMGAVDNAWGQKVRGRSRLIAYPENLPIAPVGENYDERLRLFYVAMTRARRSLIISLSRHTDTGSNLLPASFLVNDTWSTHHPTLDLSIAERTTQEQVAWYSPLLPEKEELASLLAPVLENYKLSATHLNNFLDVTRGGPQHFLIQNLLRFPESMSPSAIYGSAIHKTLQQAHSHLRAHQHRKPIEDIISDFEKILQMSALTEKDMSLYSGRGTDYLQQFLDSHYDTFTPNQQPELGFSYQHSMLEDVHLTGSLDLVDIDKTDKTIVVTDYKTGKPSSSWQGKTDQEKIKLHKYRQQLLFYKLLVEHSRDYHNYSVERGIIQYIEPDQSSTIRSLELTFEPPELEQFGRLVAAVWQKIKNADFIDTHNYEQSFKGITAFENDLLDM